MKVSYQWLSKYIDLKDVSASELADLLTRAGIEVESLEPLASGTQLVVGLVLECSPHPESDHLSLTKVNVGDRVLSIVCGAPNVRKDQKVIVAQVGSVLPELVIKEATIKGQKSEGMICSLSELGVDPKQLSDAQKAGIEVLDESAPIGVEALAYCGLDDVILDIKPTPNRADITALFNLALEVSALIHKDVHLPWIKDYHLQGKASDLIIKTKTDKCPLILGKKIGKLTVKPSPDWLSKALSSIGMKSINNVVDISNYVMLVTGQPLHFYDANKLPKAEICVEQNITEAFYTLDGTQIQAHPEDLIITSNKKPIGLAGIMGGEDSKIDESTTSIVIEAAQFNPSSIRHSSRRVNLMTEASLRFQKGVDPYSAFKAMDEALRLLVELADAEDIEETIMDGHFDASLKSVSVSHEHIENLLGIKVDPQKAFDTFKSLHFNPELLNGIYHCTIPSYRLDIELAEDLIEEVGRFIGYDQRNGTLPVLPATAGGYNHTQKMRNQLHRQLLGFGLNEVMTYTLVHESKTQLGVLPLDHPASLISPISEERKYIRNSLLPSVLEVVAYNQAHKIKDFGIFEFTNLNTLTQSQERLALVLSGQNVQSLWQKQVLNYDYYAIKGMIQSLLDDLGIQRNRVGFVADEHHALFHPKRCVQVLIDKKVIGYCGEIHPSQAKTLGISSVILAELNLSALFDLKKSKVRFSPINKYPSVTRDYAFVLDKSVKAEALEAQLRAAAKNMVVSIDIFDVYEGDKISADQKSIALKVVYQADDHTLTEQEISEFYQRSIELCTQNLKAQLRS